MLIAPENYSFIEFSRLAKITISRNSEFEIFSGETTWQSFATAKDF
ncbi:MAG: hypothetical protein POELPBGB_01451 [Bacteroidia bacterium]|nr:hypothetical protein [Bacteroidia bacterium]